MKGERLHLEAVGRPEPCPWPWSDPWHGATLTAQEARKQLDAAWEMFLDAMQEAPNLKVERKS